MPRRSRARAGEELAARAELRRGDPDVPRRMKDLRERYLIAADSIGSMPRPAAAGRSGVLRKRAPAISAELLDRLCARHAFERTSVRLYDALLGKHDASGSFQGGPSRRDLEQHRVEKLVHVALLDRTVTLVGGDPAALTPHADIEATATSGVSEVVLDPRTTLRESLKALLIAELVDADGWRDLLTCVRGEPLIRRLEGDFAGAVARECGHLEQIHRWLSPVSSETTDAAG